MNKLPVKSIQYGAFTLDVACDADGNAFLTTRAIEKLLNWRANQLRKKIESKSLKSFTDKDLSLVKIKGKVEGVKSKAVNLYPVDLAVLLITWDAVFNQNAKAIAILSSSFATDIKSTILKGFGHEIATDSLRLQEQFRWLRVFQLREWTNIIRDRHLELFGCKPSNEYYRDCIVMVNLALFGCYGFEGDRDNMDGNQQRLINEFESFLARKASKYPDYDPKELITQCLPMFV